jgi:hypothetical protein
MNEKEKETWQDLWNDGMILIRNINNGSQQA